ncbi:hypothetical protein HNQ79_004331 [Streptomyces candidus]|uniref:Uncharacterized protein n=1 Tax=Streptomyces candidus TaxID=67283 RepID=A0A7X0HK25_9ACTN|nr:hypothetical protein [Streptomyces candidus]
MCSGPGDGGSGTGAAWCAAGAYGAGPGPGRSLAVPRPGREARGGGGVRRRGRYGTSRRPAAYGHGAGAGTDGRRGHGAPGLLPAGVGRRPGTPRGPLGGAASPLVDGSHSSTVHQSLAECELPGPGGSGPGHAGAGRAPNCRPFGRVILRCGGKRAACATIFGEPPGRYPDPVARPLPESRWPQRPEQPLRARHPGRTRRRPARGRTTTPGCGPCFRTTRTRCLACGAGHSPGRADRERPSGWSRPPCYGRRARTRTGRTGTDRRKGTAHER